MTRWTDISIESFLNDPGSPPCIGEDQHAYQRLIGSRPACMFYLIDSYVAGAIVLIDSGIEPPAFMLGPEYAQYLTLRRDVWMGVPLDTEREDWLLGLAGIIESDWWDIQFAWYRLWIDPAGTRKDVEAYNDNLYLLDEIIFQRTQPPIDDLDDEHYEGD